MKTETFEKSLARLNEQHQALINRPNHQVDESWNNGLFDRYLHPVVTGAHAPIFWRFDLNPATNPFLIEHLGMNAAF